MNKINYSVHEFKIAAGSTIIHAKDSGFVSCLEASEPFKIGFDDGSLNHFEGGLTYTPTAGFRQVALHNPNDTEIRIQLGFGRGDISDARLTLSGQVSTQEAMPETFTTGAAIDAATGATTLLADVNPFRREIILVNDGAGRVYIGGDAGAAAGEGLPMEAGASMVLSTRAAVYARNDTGAVVPVAVAELGS